MRSSTGGMKAPPAIGGCAVGSPATIRAPAASSSAIFCANVVALAEADERAHARILGARVADLGLGQALGERLLDRIEIIGRRHRAADRGAFLPRLHRHLGRDFLDEQVELRRSRRRVGPKQRGIEAVLLGDEPDRFRE